MGKGSRLRASRASLPPFRGGAEAQRDLKLRRPRAGVEIAILPGACRHDHDAIEEMKRRTHDGLIKMLGHRRRSGIWWNIFIGASDCARQMTQLYPPDDQDEETRAGLRQFYAHFDAEGASAVLVVAACEGIRAAA